jgi:hypothetical protein
MRVLAAVLIASVIGCGSAGQDDATNNPHQQVPSIAPLRGAAPAPVCWRGTELARGEASYLAVDASTVFWTEPTTGRVMAVPIAGGPSRVIAEHQGNPKGLAVHEDWLFWTTGTAGTIVKARRSGADRAVVVSGENNPSALAIHDGFLYWANYGMLPHYYVPDGSIARMPLGGGSISILASGRERGFRAALLAVTSTHVYWSNSALSGVGFLDLRTGTFGGIGGSNRIPGGLAADGPWVFFSNANESDPNQFTSRALDNATLARFACGNGDVVLDRDYVYCSGLWAGTLTRVPRAASAPAVTLVCGETHVGQLAVDESNVYWTNHLDHTIRKTPKL